MSLKSVIIICIRKKSMYGELKRNTFQTLFIFFLLFSSSLFFEFFSKKICRSWSNKSCCCDGWGNKQIRLVDSLVLLSLALTYYSRSSILNLFLFEENFLKRQTSSPSALFRTDFFICFVTNHAAGLLLLSLFCCHYGWCMRK